MLSSGIALGVTAVSNPVLPLNQRAKNLLKLYMNDVGILSSLLYGNNIRAILDDTESINLGAVYETVVAQQLEAQGCQLFYYDNRSKGEVDYLINDYANLSVIPIEVKSGRDYTIHSALSNFVSNKDYRVQNAYVLLNEGRTEVKGGIIYTPIYNIMSFKELTLLPEASGFGR